MTDKQLEAKVVLLGDSGVGKTSIAVRYVQGLFAEDQPPTIGASFFTKRLFVSPSLNHHLTAQSGKHAHNFLCCEQCC